MKSLRSAALLIVVLAQGACAGDAPAEAQSVRTTETDGVLNVRVASLAATDVPALTATEVFNTAHAEPAVELYQVSAARFLPDGRLAVANAGTSEIFVLGATGVLERKMGRKGEGPGEFAWISGLDFDTAGSLIAYDPRQGRLTRLTAAGEVISTQTLAPPNRVVDIQPLTVLADGRFPAVYSDQRMFGTSGEARDTTPLMLFEADGTRSDTIGMWAATEWAFRSFEGGASRSRPGFGRTAEHAGRNGRFAIGSTDSLDVSVFGSDGRLAMRITGGQRAEVRSADVERWRADLIESYSDRPEAMRRGLDEIPHRLTYPGFEGLVVDDEGRIWIGSYVAAGGIERDWLVLASDGRPYGRLTLPVGETLLDAAGDQVAVTGRDDLDEQYIRVLRIAAR